MRAAVALAAVLLAGCGSISECRTPADLKPNDAIVVGRVRAKLFGRTITEWNTRVVPFGGYELEFVAPDGGSEDWAIPRDGVFACRVPAGIYTIRGGTWCLLDNVDLGGGATLNRFQMYGGQYWVWANGAGGGTLWSWGPTQVGFILDGGVSQVTLEPGRTYWIGDRYFEIDGKAFEQGPRSFRLQTTTRSFWLTEDDFKKALHEKYPWIDVSTIIRVPSTEAPPPAPPPAPPSAPAPAETPAGRAAEWPTPEKAPPPATDER